MIIELRDNMHDSFSNRPWRAIGYVNGLILRRHDHACKFEAMHPVSGTLTPLDSAEVLGEIYGTKKVGRTPASKVVQIRIDSDAHDLAVRLGNGNFSEGVRIALRACK